MNVPCWPPLMKDWAQQLLMVLRAVCMSEVSRSNQLTLVSSCRLMIWFISMRCGNWASHCLVVMGSYKEILISWPPSLARSLEVATGQHYMWCQKVCALHLHHSYGSWTIAEGTVISLKSETLDMLSWHQWSFSFLSSLPCSKSGVEQAFKLIWTHKNI